MSVYPANASRICRACGEKVGCMAFCRSGLEYPIDCETGEELERCPHCGEGGRWWVEGNYLRLHIMGPALERLAFPAREVEE